MWTLLVAVALAAEPAAPPPVDVDALAAETVEVLTRYLQVDTINPPGNESRGAAFFASILDREGIGHRTIEHAPGRASIIARLPATVPATEKPLCLMSHLDVATAEPERWKAGAGPLSGAIVDGQIWGRGALDMKGLGAIELMTLVGLARAKAPLRRDVILLGVADEEVSSLGMRDLIENHWKDIDCSQVLNEGGLGIRDLFFEGQTIYGISVAEKGILWARMIATGAPGHGSRPNPDSAVYRLHRAVEALGAYRAKPRMHDSFFDLFRNVSRTRGGVVRYVMAHPRLLFGRLLAGSTTAPLITDTVHVTGFGGALQNNVVPGESWANLDCRLLPGTTPEAMLARLRALVKDPNVRFEVQQTALANESPTDDSFYRALARRAVAGRADAVSGPILSIGFTDSLLLRPLGVHAYGLAPFEVTQEEAATMHGDDERVSVANVRRGLEIVLGATWDVAGQP